MAQAAEILMYLLDTNIVSELRKVMPHGGVAAWYDALRPDEISVPAVVIGEIALGIEGLRARDPRRAAELSQWLDGIDGGFAILPATGAIYRIWGQLMRKRQQHLSNDALIAATALHHGLTVATRNVDDFMPFGVMVANPFGRTR